MRVLAIAESDAYLKWAAWLLGGVSSEWSTELCVLRSPTAPSDAQISSALVGTGVDGAEVPRVSARVVGSELASGAYDIAVLACTGPTVAALSVSIARQRRRRGRRPVLVSGLPGVGLPIHERAIVARSLTDVFIAHSRREQALYSEAFRTRGTQIRVGLLRLPFLEMDGHRPRAGDRIVFAAQPSVPRQREQRCEVLRRLAAVGPPAPIVKLRGRTGEHMTHDEAWPYPDLWRQMVEIGEVETDQVEFAWGPTSLALERARCVVTVSSTLAIEAIARGVPVVILDDFGVSGELLNEVFVGSGLLGPLTASRIDAAGQPDREWLEENYFHSGDSPAWTELAVDLADAPVEPGSLSVGVLRAAARRTVRLLIPEVRRS